MERNIRTRLTFQFTGIVLFILVLYTFIIYFFSATYRESEFYSRLENKAINTARLLIEVNEVNYDLLKVIDRNTINALYNEKVVIYDYKDEQIYNSLDDDSIQVSKELLDNIRLKKEVRFRQGQYEVLGLLYADKYDRFVVIASAIDKYGHRKLNYLKWIIIIGFFASIGLTVFMGRKFAHRALKPMSNVVKQVDKINIASLNMRVSEGNGTDEIAQLAITFNRMLERLESAFVMQRSFVSNASHELRTPLTSITGQIEVSLMKPRSREEYEVILQSVLEDIRNLNALSNGLLDLAKASSDISAIDIRALRLDEILWETRTELLKRNPGYTISILFSQPIEDELQLTVQGNEHLLKIAMINVMENACKYSGDQSVVVALAVTDKNIVCEFSDKGIGIDPAEIGHIFQPFYRANNVKNKMGNGLGLSLADKIIALHHGTISIVSELNKGTAVTISIPFIS